MSFLDLVTIAYTIIKKSYFNLLLLILFPKCNFFGNVHFNDLCILWKAKTLLYL